MPKSHSYTVRDVRWLSALFLLFSVLSILGILRHEVWLDEAHHWLLARDSETISSLAYNMRYEGHPLLWNVLLFAASSLSKNVIAMQAVHLAISITACGIFLRKAPFSVLHKALIIFGYYFFFEYNLISRNYSLAWLIMVAITSLIFSQRRNDYLIVILLALLANTHLFALICSFALFFVLLYKRKRELVAANHSWIWLIYGGSIFIAIWQIIPPEDSLVKEISLQEPFFTKERLFRFLSLFAKSTVYVPDFLSENFWQENLFYARARPLGHFLYGLSLLTPLLLLRSKLSLFFYYLTCGGIAIVLFVIPLNAPHYFGFGFMILLVAVWIDRAFTQSESARYSFRFSESLFTALLLVQGIAGVCAYCIDLSRPFSHGKDVAEYLNANYNPSSTTVVCAGAGPPIAAYTKHALFYPEQNMAASFYTWNKDFVSEETEVRARINAARENAEGKKLVLVIASTSKYSNVLIKEFRHAMVKSFTNAIVRGENYFVVDL